ncbi:ubiquitin-like protein Pup [Sphingobacterium oryzagri]|uniref:Ubiquitin-like protein Pup n=1 Tax=Sphingobacterium oryzagri TaxID=3025669 RepID=A0ABY7WIG1_9SPHI|nr:ubiquitin-like protein Pup [Sphingobacterium sp. KACC 22765]WDF69391.1 ubiquitin-like protein Pup [Sphingobacterium sp. KACC 22765]
MVEYFTQDEHDTQLSETKGAMLDKIDEILEENLKSSLTKLVKAPSAKTVEHILNYSKSLTK